jgi:hypothetical protein
MVIDVVTTLDEMAEKAAGISEKHYGSRQAMMDAAKKRNETAAYSQHFTRPRSNLEITYKERRKEPPYGAAFCRLVSHNCRNQAWLLKNSRFQESVEILGIENA